MSSKKLFSTGLKAELAGLSANYAFNKSLANGDPFYSRQATGYALQMYRLFIQVTAAAENDEDLEEILLRIKDDLKMKKEVSLSAKSFEERHSQLNSWLSIQLKAASTKFGRLNRIKIK